MLHVMDYQSSWKLLINCLTKSAKMIKFNMNKISEYFYPTEWIFVWHVRWSNGNLWHLEYMY